jgi:ABC-2 type transport system permease protein
MHKILAIIRKDVLERFSNRLEWLFFLVLPVFFSFVLAGGTGASSDQRIRLVVVDQASTPLSAELVATLERSDAVRPDTMSLSRAEDQFSQRRVSAMLVIPQGLDPSGLLQGVVTLELRQQPNNVNALAAERAVRAAIQRVGSAVSIAMASAAEAERIRPFSSDAARQAYLDAALSEARNQMNAAPSRVSAVQGGTEDPIKYDPRANSSAGQLITWVFIPLLGISALFALDRQRGTLRRLLTSPTRRATYLLGTLAGQCSLAFLQMLLLATISALLMGVRWGRSPLAMATMLISAILAAAALGTALGTLVKTEAQANGLSIMLGMVMAMMGGCWYPNELFPQVVRDVTRILPTTWAMRGVLDILVRGQDLAGIALEAGVLLGFAALFLTVGIARFRYE